MTIEAHATLHDDSRSSQISNKPYKATKYRFVMSVLYAMVSIINAIMWISTSPITKNLENIYNIGLFQVNFCTSLIWFAVYPPMNFVANYFLDEKGLRVGILIGSCLTLVGLWIRTFSEYSFYYIFLGQLFGAIGQPFLLNAPQKLSAVWYPQEERALSTTIASVSNPIGVGIGFVLAQMFVDNGAEGSQGLKQVHNLMLFSAGLGTLLTFPLFFLFKNKPKVPPSKTADTEKYSYKQSLKSLFGNKNYLVFIISIGLVWGSYNVLATVLQPLLQPYGVTESQSGNLGAITLVSGLVGSIVWGIYVDNTKRYKFSVVICGLLSIASLGAIAAVVPQESYLLVCLATGVYGFFTTPVFPLAYEFSAELSFPVAEAASGGLMVVMTQIFGALGTVGIDALIDDSTKRHTMIAFAVLGGVALLGFIGLTLAKEELKRTKTDNDGGEGKKGESYANDTSSLEEVKASLLIKPISPN